MAHFFFLLSPTCFAPKVCAVEDLNRSLDRRKRLRNEGPKGEAQGEAAFQDATTSKAQAVERNGNEENKRGKEREAGEAAAKRADQPSTE